MAVQPCQAVEVSPMKARAGLSPVQPMTDALCWPWLSLAAQFWATGAVGADL